MTRWVELVPASFFGVECQRVRSLHSNWTSSCDSLRVRTGAGALKEASKGNSSGRKGCKLLEAREMPFGLRAEEGRAEAGLFDLVSCRCGVYAARLDCLLLGLVRREGTDSSG